MNDDGNIQHTGSGEESDIDVEDQYIAESDVIPLEDRIHVVNDDEIYKLPDLITLENPMIGEPKYMKRKRIRNAIRFHENKDKNGHEYLHSQVLLYYPFQNENRNLEDARECKDAGQKLFSTVQLSV